MYLKSITLKGFKSFPDRTRLEFGPGVSVIVGPNGSGKSNVTDAVLWALGEQSPVAVRGHSMQDVIFGGAPGRQAAKDAEVELVIDDTDGALALGAPEISILRRLDRAGEGEYRMAGARCRLVDVIELLSDTGLGKEMHSVISQGRVEAIVTSKPRDRRLLIEEAAGLGKHRKRRRRAQLKLARTQDNLDRALDVEREARSRLRPLKRQAEAAELHARLERQSLEASWELARDELRLQQGALVQAQAEASKARSRREQLERELHAVSEHRETAEEALAARSAQREELSRRCFAAQSAEERISYRTEALEAAAATLENRLRRAGALLSALQTQDGADHPDARAQARIAELQSELEALDLARATDLAGELSELERAVATSAARLAEQAIAADQSLAIRRDAESAVEQGVQTVREAERLLSAARRRTAGVGAELAAVNQFLRSHESSQGGVSALADELEVDSGYELALAAALDGRLRATVVADRSAASAILRGPDGEGGRALVASGERRPQDLERLDPPAPGAQPLIDHVRGGARAVELVRALLRDTWVVEAVEDVPDSFDGVAVTQSGRVWSAVTWELRQSASVGDERILAERNRREQLLAATEQAVEAEQVAGRTLEHASARLADLELTRERALDANRKAAGAHDEAAEEQRRLKLLIERRKAAPDDGPNAARRAQVLAELAAERSELERAERERGQRATAIEQLRAATTRDELLRPALVSLIGALRASAQAISEQGCHFQELLAADRAVGEQVAAQLRSCAQQEATLQAQLHGENEELTALEVQAQRVRDRVGEAEQMVEQLASTLKLEAVPASEELSAQERQALTERIGRLARRREQLGPVNPLAEQEYVDAVEHVEELERQRSDLEAALRELQKLITDTDRQIREAFEQTFEAAAGNFEELAAQLFPGGRGRLRLVSERGGPAPVLGAQASPVQTDRPEADEAEEFDQGSEEEELLGVEIEITPAGKQMKRLSLLSGGEKSMTALAFLFAVFLAKPCPFYILDEVEAALDDLNIDRFLELLRRYSARSQFIVVTHQKRTMEAADSLYGVSMGGDGVSKVISRRLPPAEAAA